MTRKCGHDFSQNGCLHCLNLERIETKRLRAISVDLLEACKAAIRVYGKWDDAFSRKVNTQLKAAIAKAEKES